MKITTINYKRLKNLGNYQSETLEMTAVIDPDSDAIAQANQLRDKVMKVLYPPEVPQLDDVAF